MWLSRLLPNARHSPSGWAPTDALPSGMFETTTRLTTRATSSIRLAYEPSETIGERVCGTCVFRAGRPSSAQSVGSSDKNREKAVAVTRPQTAEKTGLHEVPPPSYDQALSSGTAEHDIRQPEASSSTGSGEVTLVVVARFNDTTLWDETKIELQDTGSDLRTFSIETPEKGLARLSSQISFHVTVYFPPSLASIASLYWTGPHWRLLGDSSLATMHFVTARLQTKSTPITFEALSIGTGDITTDSGPISGKYRFAFSLRDRPDVATGSGKIHGLFQFAESGAIRSKSGGIDATASADRRLEVSTLSGSISGTYEGKDELHVDTTSANVKVLLRSARQINVKSSSGRLDATIELGGIEPAGIRQPRGKLVAQAQSGGMNVVVKPWPKEIDVDLAFKAFSGPVKVLLPSCYDGSFRTSPGILELHNGHAFQQPHSGSSTFKLDCPPASMPDGCRVAWIKTQGGKAEGALESGGNGGKRCTLEVASNAAVELVVSS